MATHADPPEEGDVSRPCTDRQSAGEPCVAVSGVRRVSAKAVQSDRAVTPRDGWAGTAGPAVAHAPEVRYLAQIAMLEARIETLEAALETKERDLQHVVDRYEHVLQGRDACRDEPLGDLDIEDAERTDRDGSTADESDARTTLDRLRALLR